MPARGALVRLTVMTLSVCPLSFACIGALLAPVQPSSAGTTRHARTHQPLHNQTRPLACSAHTARHTQALQQRQHNWRPHPCAAIMQRQGPGWFVEITGQPLNQLKYTQLVTSPEAGAISTFIGTTRNNFQGRAVLRLEYEAYAPMAVKKLQELCQQVHQKWQVTSVAVAHRTGVVEVAEASVIIAVSSAHRQAALQAVHWAIDELKATVPIWKKEFFEDGSIWKENPESRAGAAAAAAAGAAS